MEENEENLFDLNEPIDLEAIDLVKEEESTPLVENPFDWLKAETVPVEFLERTARNHDWIFGAIAELVDNSLDASAKHVWIDVEDFPHMPFLPMKYYNPESERNKMLIIQDDGIGVDALELHEMVKPYTSKKDSFNHNNIGQYGIGVKSGTMRVAKDAIFFSVRGSQRCIGLLSRTFLEDNDFSDYCVPILEWKDEEAMNSVRNLKNFQIIQNYTPFQTYAELNEQLNRIGPSGVRIVLFNLKHDDNSETKKDVLELNFEVDSHDIQIYKYDKDEENEGKGPEQYSFRHFLSILYHDPKVKIFLRGLKIRFQRLDRTLYLARKEYYQPLNPHPLVPTKGVEVTFGFNIVNRDLNGLMIYHKKRLILRYHRLEKIHHNNKGSKYVGIMAVFDAPFLDVNPMKNDFLKEGKRYAEYQHLMNWLVNAIRKYWRACQIDINDGGLGIRNFWNSKKKDPPCWIQCDNINCLKWREVKKKNLDKIPYDWTCEDCTKEEQVPDISNIPKQKRKRRTKEEIQRERREESKRRKIFSGDPKGISEARLIIAREDFKNILLHTPQFVTTTEWNQLEEEVLKEIPDIRKRRLREYLLHFEASIFPEYKQTTWKSGDWKEKLLDESTDGENLQEYVNDLDYLCLNWKLIKKKEEGKITKHLEKQERRISLINMFKDLRHQLRPSSFDNPLTAITSTDELLSLPGFSYYMDAFSALFPEE